jgi:toxin ParE1/3/4
MKLEYAITQCDMLILNCQKIAENPNMGKNYNGITENLFGLKTNRHIIFYRQIAEIEIEITRILHEQMDLENRILE